MNVFRPFGGNFVEEMRTLARFALASLSLVLLAALAVVFAQRILLALLWLLTTESEFPDVPFRQIPFTFWTNLTAADLAHVPRAQHQALLAIQPDAFDDPCGILKRNRSTLEMALRPLNKNVDIQITASGHATKPDMTRLDRLRISVRSLDYAAEIFSNKQQPFWIDKGLLLFEFASHHHGYYT